MDQLNKLKIQTWLTDVSGDWIMKILDASGCVMGRLASHAAKSLLNGDEIHIINAEEAVISGNKDSVMGEYIEKRQLNHPRKGPFYPRMPHLMLKRAVRGMIPYQKPRGREAFKRLRVDIGKPASIISTPNSSNTLLFLFTQTH